jgi:predicted RNA-binding protein
VLSANLHRLYPEVNKNIYGVTLLSQKENGTKTELWIRRALERGTDIPEIAFCETAAYSRNVTRNLRGK